MEIEPNEYKKFLRHIRVETIEPPITVGATVSTEGVAWRAYQLLVVDGPFAAVTPEDPLFVTAVARAIDGMAMYWHNHKRTDENGVEFVAHIWEVHRYVQTREGMKDVLERMHRIAMTVRLIPDLTADD